MRGKVLIAAPVHNVLTEGLTSEGYDLVHAGNITQDIAFELIRDCEGVITSTRLQLNKELLDAGSQLKWIGRMGSGMEVIDVHYATEKNIICHSSPEGNCNAVGEHALGMLLSLTKKISASHNEVKQGKWLRDENRGIELEGKTIGIIGFGHTGKAFAKKLKGFDVRILAYDTNKKRLNHSDINQLINNDIQMNFDDIHQGHGKAQLNHNCITPCDTLEQIFQEADIVSFHVPLQPDTKHYFNDRFITQMNRPFILVNTSRGIVVDTQALYNGIHTGKIIGACLDVIEEEPLNKMSDPVRTLVDELLKLPQVIITPHIAGYSQEALYKMSYILLNKIVTAA